MAGVRRVLGLRRHRAVRVGLPVGMGMGPTVTATVTPAIGSTRTVSGAVRAIVVGGAVGAVVVGVASVAVRGPVRAVVHVRGPVRAVVVHVPLALAVALAEALAVALAVVVARGPQRAVVVHGAVRAVVRVRRVLRLGRQGGHVAARVGRPHGVVSCAGQRARAGGRRLVALGLAGRRGAGRGAPRGALLRRGRHEAHRRRTGDRDCREGSSLEGLGPGAVGVASVEV